MQVGKSIGIIDTFELDLLSSQPPPIPEHFIESPLHVVVCH